jgi:hypothetical protein
MRGSGEAETRMRRGILREGLGHDGVYGEDPYGGPWVRR